MTNVFKTLEDWTKALDSGYSIDIIYLDYQKTFDMVPHKRLSNKKNGMDSIGNCCFGLRVSLLTGK